MNSEIIIKVTVNVGTDQNFEIEIFEEYKYALKELLITKTMFFNTFNSLRDMTNDREFLPELRK